VCLVAGSLKCPTVGQFEVIEGHPRALREVSDILNNRSGVVAHEVVSDGSIWFGHDSRTTNPPQGTHPAAVAPDGRPVTSYQITSTSRGVEVTVATTAGRHTLTITV
jgi:hypothetical protein